MTANRVTMIYCLCTEDDVPFYVGATVHSLGIRFSQHAHAVRQGSDQPVCRKMAELIAQGHTVRAEPIELCNPHDSWARETHWISKLSEQGFKLANVAGAPLPPILFESQNPVIAAASLQTFLIANSMTASLLARHVGMAIPAVWRMVNNKAPISNGFRWRFLQAFGPEVAAQVFGSNHSQETPNAS